MHAWKLTTGIGAVFLTASLACGSSLAAPHGGGGGGGGGGAPHIGGGGGAPHFGGGGAPHIGGGGMPHIGGGGMPHIGGGGAPHFAPQISVAPHVSAAPHIVSAPHFAPNVGTAGHFAPHMAFGRHGGGISHIGPRTHFGAHTHIGRIGHGLNGPAGAHGRTATHAGPVTGHGTHGNGVTHNAGVGNGNAANNHAATNAERTVGLHASANHVTGAAAPQAFAAHRNFTHVGALRPFLNEPWFRRHHHLGWIGPLFWPYAYGDIFYYALWPYEYDYYDPFWAYGYGDVYEAIFPPYDYSSYVGGGYGSYGRGYSSYRRGRGGAARLATLTKSVAQSCTDEAAEVTGWPIDQIQDVVQPNGQQKPLLDDLGNAIVQASDLIKSHCPTRVSFTAPDRLADMQQRLTGLVQAVGIVQPPLAKFYDSLNDEQKARFNALGEPSGQNGPQGQQAAQNLQSQCGENAIAWPADRIDAVVHPNGEQRAKLDALSAAASEAADGIKAACPSELPATPPDRLAAEGKRLQAILQAVETMRPKLDDFYASLSNEQKARFNTIGRQLFAAR